jgi:hypothetical protein
MEERTMKLCLTIVLAAVATMLVCGCLSVQAPSEVSVGSSPPPKADCGPTPKTYEAAVAAWRQLCDRNAYLEQRNARLERKYQDAKHDKEEYKRKYKKLKDKYDD